MKFVAKEEPVKHLELGDIIEYIINDVLKRYMVVKGFNDEGLWGYRLFDLENVEVLEEMYDEFIEIVDAHRKFKGFRIIKSSNLELREV